MYITQKTLPKIERNVKKYYIIIYIILIFNVVLKEWKYQGVLKW